MAQGSPLGFVARDAVAGLLVSLLALPLCLGIALASGFPPVAGVITAVVGGLVASPLGSAPLTIKGPAAGLIVIVLGAVQELGAGDLALGYRATLAVGVVAAVVQILLAWARVGSLADMFPTSVLQGMLAAIGVLLFSRQAHVLLGVTPTAKEPLALLAEIPHSVLHAQLPVVVIALASLAVFLLWPRMGLRWLPAPVVVVAVGVFLGALFDFSQVHVVALGGHPWTVGPHLLVALPSDLSTAIVTPDFSRVLSWPSLRFIVTLSLVGTIESLLSARAIDALDARSRQPDLSRDLLSAGVGNLVSSLVGGLPMISEIVRSSANVAAGGRTPLANAFHGLFLLVFVGLLPAVIQLVPLAALAALLVHTAVRLASPAVFRAAHDVGRGHLTVVLTTCAVTLATDLLVGTGAGLLVNAVLCLGSGASLRDFFRPRIQVEHQEATSLISVRNAAVFTGIPALRRAVLVAQNDRVIVDLSRTRLVDHTTLERLHELSTVLAARGKELTISGLDHHQATSPHPRATRRKA